MAYDEALADRIRAALASRDDVVEKKMFGGLCFMVAGHMACGVLGEDMLARVGEANLAAALALRAPRKYGRRHTCRSIERWSAFDHLRE